MEKMQFNAFKFSTPLFENIKVLPLGVKSNVLKISPEHSPGRSLVNNKGILGIMEQVWMACDTSFQSSQKVYRMKVTFFVVHH